MADQPKDFDEALADPTEATSAAEDTIEFRPAEDQPKAEADGTSVESQLAEAEDRVLRLQAELQNVLNRTRREVADERRYGALGLARDLLPVVDNIDRALEAAAKSTAEGDEPAGLADGFRMVREQLLAILGQHGCQPIATEPGVEFDPAQHEAILQQPSDEVAAGAIVIAVQSGYQLHDRVVRAAQVIVSSGPAATE